MSGYDIIVLAGQSNAEGTGVGKGKNSHYNNCNILELVDKNRALVRLSGDGILSLPKPYEWNLQIANERKDIYVFADFAQSFAEEYISKGRLNEGRKILIVKTAIGGTGFVKNHWGKGCSMTERALEMIDYALSLEDNSRIVAILWHQGEHDASEGPELSTLTREMFYYDKFSCLVDTFVEKYGKTPIIAGGFTDEWSKGYISQCNAIIKATKKVLKRHDGTVVSTKGLKSNNQDSNNGDTVHFCRKALYTLGKRYYAAFEKISNNKVELKIILHYRGIRGVNMSGYDIIVLAGQSNAEGCGVGKVKEEFVSTPQIMEFSDKHDISIIDTETAKGVIKETKPYEFVLREANEKHVNY